MLKKLKALLFIPILALGTLAVVSYLPTIEHGRAPAIVQMAHADEPAPAISPSPSPSPTISPSAGDQISEPSGDEYLALVKSLGGLKGAGALAIAAFICQVLMLLLRASLGQILGRYRLLILSALSLVSGVLALSVAGVGFPAALVHSGTLATFQVFVNQIFKQFSKAT